MRRLMAAGAALLLAACSPQYDWRELRSADQGWSVMLPGKPATMTRRVMLESDEVSMTMQGARVDETTFTAAVAELAEDTPEARARAVAAMRKGMLHNVSGRVTAVREARVQVIDAGGAKLGELAGERLEASGEVKGRTVTMLAGFVASGRRAWQWVVIGPEVDRVQAETFFEGFRVMKGAQ